MPEDLPREEVLLVIDRSIDELLEEAGVACPPVDAVVLAKRHPVLAETLEKRLSRAKATPDEMDPDELQWIAATVVGDDAKPIILRHLGIDPADRRPLTGESLSSLYATRLLLPEACFPGDAAECAFDLLALKDRYRTASHERIAFRLLDLPEPCVITIVDNDEVYKRKSNAWRVSKELAAAEKKCQRYVSEHRKVGEARGGKWRVQGWPVPHSMWNRVVLRSVFEGE